MNSHHRKGIKTTQMQPTALMVPVPDWEAGLAWYQRAFPDAELISLPELDFRVLQVGEFLIEVVSSDEKVPSGMSGTICYWGVDDLIVAIDRFLALGSHVHRGPMQIENGMGMCQMTDTFGNLIGLRGKYPISSNSDR